MGRAVSQQKTGSGGLVVVVRAEADDPLIDKLDSFFQGARPAQTRVRHTAQFVVQRIAHATKTKVYLERTSGARAHVSPAAKSHVHDGVIWDGLGGHVSRGYKELGDAQRHEF